MIVVRDTRFWTLPRYIGRRLALLFAFDVAVAGAYVFVGWKWLALPAVDFRRRNRRDCRLPHASAYPRWETRTI